MGVMEWMVMYIILLNITSNKGCRVWATTIECQNAFAPFQCCAFCGGQNIRDYEWYKVQMHVLKVRSVHSIHSLWKSKRLATYMQCMGNNSLEIRIAGSSCRPWLSFIEIQTCQYILANSFWVKLINLFKCMRFLSFYGRSFLKRPRYFHTFPTIFRRLPNFAKKCVKLFWQPLSNSEVISSVKGKLNWIVVINHVLKNNYYVCQVWEIVLVSEWNQGLEISSQAWNSCIMC